jgi:hypothetical protein
LGQAQGRKDEKKKKKKEKKKKSQAPKDGDLTTKTNNMTSMAAFSHRSNSISSYANLSTAKFFQVFLFFAPN